MKPKVYTIHSKTSSVQIQILPVVQLQKKSLLIFFFRNDKTLSDLSNPAILIKPETRFLKYLSK